MLVGFFLRLNIDLLFLLAVVEVSPQTIEHMSLVFGGLELGYVKANGILRAAGLVIHRLWWW